MIPGGTGGTGGTARSTADFWWDRTGNQWDHPPASTLLQITRLANPSYLTEVEAMAIPPPKA
jgi:hypothetical protein